MFEVRIHSIDYCLAAPTSFDTTASVAPIQRAGRRGRSDTDGNRLGLLPIIRIFGNTADGVACLHVHGVFPYLYVPFHAHFSFDDIDRVTTALRHGIDNALGRPTVLAVTPVRGVPFYGFHVGLRLFLKIYLLDPATMPRVADLLRQGRLAGLPAMMPHEAHIPFLLQFMTDYNLYGCDLLCATTAYHRAASPPDSFDLSDLSDLSDLAEYTSGCRQFDIAAHHIRNRDAVLERLQHDSFPEVPNAPNERLVSSMASLWREVAAKYNKKGQRTNEQRRTWKQMASTQDAFAQLAASSSDPRRTPSAWPHDAAYRRQIADIITAEKDGRQQRRPDPLEECLATTRQSIEDFYPAQERTRNRKRKREEHGGQYGQASRASHKSLDPQDALDSVASEIARGSQRQQKLKSESNTAHGRLSSRPLSQTFPVVKSYRQEKGPSSSTKSNSQPHVGPESADDAASETGSAYSSDDDTGGSSTIIPSTPDFQLSTPRQRQDIQPGTARVPSTPAFTPSPEPSPEPSPVTRWPVADHLLKSQIWGVPTAMTMQSLSTRRAASATPSIPASDPIPHNTFSFATLPPSVDDVLATLSRHGPDELHLEAHFSNTVDICRSKYDETASRPLQLVPLSVSAFCPEDEHLLEELSSAVPSLPCSMGVSSLSFELSQLPPSYGDVEMWLADEAAAVADKDTASLAQMDALRRRAHVARLPKQERAVSVGLELTEPSQSSGQTSTPRLSAEMTVLALEMHANSRGSYLPNPEQDAVQGVFWRMTGHRTRSGMISVHPALRDECSIQVVPDEHALIHFLVSLVRRLNPDILAGYETTASSWGYVAERAALYGIDLWAALGRVEQPREIPYHERGTQLVVGRHILAIGEAMHSAVDLRQYTLENVAWHVLGRRMPLYTPAVLTGWMAGGGARGRGLAMRHYSQRVAAGLALLAATDVVAQTSEQARVLGVDFASVRHRGSQFMVESVMMRVAKPENYVMPSPSREQVGGQKAAEVTPLVMEPRSGLYAGPVVVLDFTSLYPSLMIAYNLCYSTFVGKLDPLYEERGCHHGEGYLSDPHGSGVMGSGSGSGGGSIERDEKICAKEPGLGARAEAAAGGAAESAKSSLFQSLSKMGFTTYHRPTGLLDRLSRLGLVVSPTGMMYVRAQTRQSLLAKMLSEILSTRVMVKAAMAKAATDEERRRLHNRQLALKLLANVTYGYTSASFSGRMPCVEVADSIVQTGRETLQRAMALIHADKRWQAEVVYGDTDSLFVHLPGRTREQAFSIAKEMAAAVTASNPQPVRLKVEKVYQPCVLLSKKRYVGFQYESAGQEEAVFEAKGIETVRRDGSPAASKMLEQSLRLLFACRDLSRVKEYVQESICHVIQGRVSLADLCFARNVREGLESYRALPPGAMLAARRAARDPRAGLLPGERVPFVVVAGAPGASLKERCVPPEEMVSNRHLRIDVEYYVQHSLLPPLDRILRLVGVDVTQWYGEMRRYGGVEGERVLKNQKHENQQEGLESRATIETNEANEANEANERKEAREASEIQNAQPLATRQQKTLDVWLRNVQCASCHRPVRRRFGGRPDQSEPVLCRSCGNRPGTLENLQCRMRDAETAYCKVLDGCRGCAGLGPREPVQCMNLTCPVFFVRLERKARAEAEQANSGLIARLARRQMRDLEW